MTLSSPLPDGPYQIVVHAALEFVDHDPSHPLSSAGQGRRYFPLFIDLSILDWPVREIFWWQKLQSDLRILHV